MPEPPADITALRVGDGVRICFTPLKSYVSYLLYRENAAGYAVLLGTFSGEHGPVTYVDDVRGLTGTVQYYVVPSTAARQREAAETIAAQGLSVRQTEALVKRLTTEKKEREPSIEEITHKLHAHIAEEELAQSLGRGVKIVAGRKKGRIELDYYDMDDLNDLLDALGTLQQRKNGGTKK